jgi:hypothetical protein
MLKRRGLGFVLVVLVIAVFGGGGWSTAQTPQQRATTGGVLHGQVTFVIPYGCPASPTEYYLSAALTGTIAFPGSRWIGSFQIRGCGPVDEQTGTAAIPPFPIPYFSKDGWFLGVNPNPQKPPPFHEQFAVRALNGSCSGPGGSADSPQGGVSFGVTLSRITLVCDLRMGPFGPYKRVVIFATFVMDPKGWGDQRFAGVWSSLVQAPASV